ncbi:non-homologous end-joining DNA ligase [Nonomuraea sp. SYSU D8015]|uniref:non-homologous end-joining DNA ligase n=1 Tax=Nonomuraea sp. SYSU D8015 TaxID=2593644 RepID=UPI001CB70143|nr:non-homologous end-joining DNA ligase [Nonomuraea sp. SYSU D8015]
MLAQPGTLPLPHERGEWLTEIKWDGVRALMYVEDGRVRVRSRRALDMTASFPEVQRLAGAVRGKRAVLDGELVAFGPDGCISFAAMQRRLHVSRPVRVAELVRVVPVTFMAFDILYAGEESLVRRPYRERRERLEDLVTPGTHWQVPAVFDDAKAVLEATRQLGLEGIVCKRPDASYRPGSRSPAWRKVKNSQVADVVIGGWRPAGRGGRRVGRLLLGLPNGAGQLRYVGTVKTGFTDAMRTDLATRLRPLQQQRNPFTGQPQDEPLHGVRWVRPELVGEVRAMEWTANRHLRLASWRGLRPDLAPSDL